MARRIFDWRAELAWFDKGVQEALEVCAKQMYKYEDRERKAVRAVSEKHLKIAGAEAAPPLRGGTASGQEQEQEQEQHTAVRKRHGQVAPLRPDDGGGGGGGLGSTLGNTTGGS
jgi:hypothetical protein